MDPTSKYTNLDTNQYFYVTLVIIIFILIIMLSWVFNRLGLKDRSCNKLKTYWPNLTNNSYLISEENVKGDAIATFDGSSCTLINYYVKSAYNCCCGDGYKNNFVAMCALEKSLVNGCRFLDFEIYSYNNEPIVASSTAENNYIKETYNSLLLEDVLIYIKENGFNPIATNCANDPLILHFRVMSTNLEMLKKMGNLIQTYLHSSTQSFSLSTKKDMGLLTTKMRDLYKKLIIICDFNPQSNIIENIALEKLKKYTNLKAKGLYCNTYRYNQIASKKGSAEFIKTTKSKYVIVLPNLDNSIMNFDPAISFETGCQAICMKHQNIDNYILGYNALFKTNKNFSWIKKSTALLNVDVPTLPDYTGLGVDYTDDTIYD